MFKIYCMKFAKIQLKIKKRKNFFVWVDVFSNLL